MLELLETIDPWVWLVIGCLCALLDIFVSSYYLLFLGIAIATNTVWALLGMSGGQQVVLTAGATIVVGIAARRLVANRGPSLLEQHAEGLEGLAGHVLWVDPDNATRGRGALEDRGEWLIRTWNDPLQVGQHFLVIEAQGATLVVASTEDRDDRT